MFKVLSNEVYKLFAHKRIYIFMGIISIVAIFILIGAVLTNNLFLGKTSGQTFPLQIFDGEASIVMPILVILLITNLVTDEYADGTIKLPLLRKISRNKLLLGKIGAVVVVITLLLVFSFILGYILGIAFFGWGDQFIIKGDVLSSGKGIIFTLLVYGLSIISYISFGMIILLFAVLIDNSGSVVGIGMGILIVLLLVSQIFPDISLYLVSSYFNTFNLLTSGVEIKRIVFGFLIISAVGIVFYILSVIAFNRKDILT